MLQTNQQTLRIYEKEKLIMPRRTRKNTRLYSMRDVEELQRIIHLHQELGVNLAGVEVPAESIAEG
jgi:MerR family transcriptional regulator/heat shock protein HspR